MLGDGDGRFCAALLKANPAVCLDAVDSSAGMLHLLQRGAVRAHAEERIKMHHQDVRAGLPPGPFDLVCTHFFLDCLTELEITALVASVCEEMPEGHWVISEFAVPGGVARWPASVLISMLYLSFRLLAGLQVQALSDHGKVLRSRGFVSISTQTRLCGVLRAELWHRAASHAP